MTKHYTHTDKANGYGEEVKVPPKDVASPKKETPKKKGE